MYALDFFEMTNHCGNWNSTAPSLPAECSGISASRNRCQTSSTTSAGSCSRHTFFLSAGALSCRSLYSESRLVGWLVSNEYALMLNVKSGGVRSIQRAEFDSLGGK